MLLVLLPLLAGNVVLAMFCVPLAFFTVFLLATLDAGQDRAAERDAAPKDDVPAADPWERQAAIRNGTIRRAWQAAVIAIAAFPPLAIYSLGLLCKVAGRDLPLHPADRWRAWLALVASLIGIAFCLILASIFLIGIPLTIFNGAFRTRY